MTDAQVDALAEVLVRERRRARNERAAEIAALREEIAELRGYVKAMRDERTGKSSNFEDLKTGEVIDLPKNFWRKPDAA